MQASKVSYRHMQCDLHQLEALRLIQGQYLLSIANIHITIFLKGCTYGECTLSRQEFAGLDIMRGAR